MIGSLSANLVSGLEDAVQGLPGHMAAVPDTNKILRGDFDSAWRYCLYGTQTPQTPAWPCLVVVANQKAVRPDLHAVTEISSSTT